MYRKILFLVVAIFGATELSAQQGNLELKTTAAKQETVVDADGNSTTRLIPVETAVPGDEIIYTVTFSNISAEVADNVRVTNPVPSQMAFIAGSAFGPGADVSFSIDGGETFAAPEQLTITDPEVGPRLAAAEEYTHIRWTLKTPLDAGAQGFARYRARLR